MYTIKQLVEEATSKLEEKNIIDARVEAEILLEHLQHFSRMELYLHLQDTVDEKLANSYWELIEQRKKRLPLAYILGECEFMGLKFFVSPKVFIPRPETELLVEKVIKFTFSEGGSTYSEGIGAGQPLILDLGTGCGNIAISLAKFVSNTAIYATDISVEALDVAKRNAQYHGIDSRIHFLLGNLYEPLERLNMQKEIALIVCNPPYIFYEELRFLQPEIFYEPRTAYFCGENGLNYYQTIICQAKKYLCPRGYLFLEINPQSVYEIQNLFLSEGFKEIVIVKDYSGYDRIVYGQS